MCSTFREFVELSRQGVVTPHAGLLYPMAQVIPGDFYSFQNGALRRVVRNGLATVPCTDLEEDVLHQAFEKDMVEVACYRILPSQGVFHLVHRIHSPRGLGRA